MSAATDVAIPAELRERRQWVIWKRETVNGRPTKILYRAGAPGTRASSTDPATWASYDDAVRAAPAADGIGYVFSDADPYVGVDLDDVISDDVTVHPYAAELVATLDSYTELSPSGRGVHVFVRATLNGGRKRTKDTPWGSDFETYTAGRYFTVTGKPLAGTPTTINERQAELDAIRAELLPEAKAKDAPKRKAQPSPPADDAELLERARRAKNGATFDRLWHGDTSGHDDDDSAADLALCGHLAFWTGPDPARIDGLFRRSGLMREKWDSRRGDCTYGAQTIDKALSGRTEFFDSQRPARPRGGDGIPTYEVTWDTSGKMPKLVLPDPPAHDDLAGLLAWITSVLRFDPRHPATSVAHEGRRGPDGHVEIRRATASAIRFEPAAAIYSARRLVPMLGTQLQPTDGEPYGLKDEHCKRIAHVIGLGCGVSAAPTAAQEAAGIVGTLLSRAQPVEGLTTYGNTSQRYEAAVALRRDIDEYSGRARGAARYLIDANTGAIVVRVTDALEAAREHTGSTLPHGWLDARMDNLGWTRATLQGYALGGRDGRRGAHLRCDVYRGFLPDDDADEDSVNT